MNATELRDKSDQELDTLLAEKRLATRERRFGGTAAKSGNVKTARNLRREIARILTIQQTRATAPKNADKVAA